MQQAENVQGDILPKTQFYIVQNIYSHQIGWVEVELGNICILEEPRQLTIEPNRETSTPGSEPTSHSSVYHTGPCS